MNFILVQNYWRTLPCSFILTLKLSLFPPILAPNFLSRICDLRLKQNLLISFCTFLSAFLTLSSPISRVQMFILRYPLRLDPPSRRTSSSFLFTKNAPHLPTGWNPYDANGSQVWVQRLYSTISLVQISVIALYMKSFLPP